MLVLFLPLQNSSVLVIIILSIAVPNTATPIPVLQNLNDDSGIAKSE